MIDPSSTSSSDIEGDNGYRYKELDVGDIRILTVHPKYHASSEAILDCSLTIRKEGREYRDDYEALSYVWGGQDRKQEIYIRSKSGTRILRVTENLLSALKHLRFPDRPRKFWVDAVCIDQSNQDEVNRQVPLMSKIYSEAKNVCVWLGERGDNSDLAMKLLPKIRNLEDFEKDIDANTSCEEWDALIKLMGRHWFRRRWVVQEIALARRATIHCGLDETSWTNFSEAIALFQDGAALVNAKFREDKEYKHDADYVGNVAAYPASRLVVATSRVVRKSKNNDVVMKVRGLEYLVSTLTPFQALKPADSIYAVLSLAQDVPGYSTVIAPTATIETQSSQASDVEGDLGKSRGGHPVVLQALKKMRKISRKYPVDYGKPFTEICTDFLRFVFRTSQSLDMICRPWAPKSEVNNLPSWIVTLKEETHVLRRNRNTMMRRKADILVGDPGQSAYSASGRYPAVWTIVPGANNGQIKPKLIVQGFILDEISEKDDAASAGVVPETWFRVGGWDSDQDESPPEEFWRTLVADRDGEGGNPLAWYPLACKYALHHFNDEVDAVDTMRVSDGLDDPTLLKRYMQRLQSVIWGRRLARTKEHRFLALIPQMALEEDVICIIPGVSVPVVLRQRTVGGGFEYVGESYVHGMMDGEAFGIKRRMRTEYQKFELH
ncbi:HET-domain-containing protein [Lojkania enalia]|uniref:HET-domain-containing protein n=1 Tax=Lojkania enalia TaxID=147567 RepID=A0A9P4K696_9PLEO|nr:HET-domain-containing protein [Didymosphaeria enalia]